MATMLYVVNNDWISLNSGNTATYEGSTQEWTYGTDAFASIYSAVTDGNSIKIPGAVSDVDPVSPLKGDTAPAFGGKEINVINGDFYEENAQAAAGASYTLVFSSIYNIPTMPELNTTFSGKFVSQGVNNVGFKVVSDVVNFGKTAVYKKNDAGKYIDKDNNVLVDQDHPEKGGVITNRTTITLKGVEDGSCEFIVGGDYRSDYAKRNNDGAIIINNDGTMDLNGVTLPTAEAIVKNTDLTVNNGVWVGSGPTNAASAAYTEALTAAGKSNANAGDYDTFQLGTDTQRFTLTVTDSAISSAKNADGDGTALLTVRNNGTMTMTRSEAVIGDFVFLNSVTLTDSILDAQNLKGIAHRGVSNIYSEDGHAPAVLSATNSTIVVNAKEGFQIGHASTAGRKGEVSLVNSVLNANILTVAKYGTLTVDKDSKVAVAAQSIIEGYEIAGDGTLTNNGSIVISVYDDPQSETKDQDWITASTFTNTDGTLTINAAALTDAGWKGVKRVVYAANGNVDLTKVSVDNGYDKATRKGKVAIANGVDYTTLYVSNAIDEDKDFAKTVPSKEPKDYYVDFNAFGEAKSTLENQKYTDDDPTKAKITKTILIDGATASALDYAGATKASIDGLTFKKDGTNAASATAEEKDVTFALSGMDFTKSSDIRTLVTGITIGEGVVFSADKMYQRGWNALTTVEGTLEVKKYTQITPDDPATDANEQVNAAQPFGDNFMIAGGTVAVTGSLIGGGTVSANATNRYLVDTVDGDIIHKAGDPIQAFLNISAGKNNTIGGKADTPNADKLSLVIGSNATVTITGELGTNEAGKSVVVSNDVLFNNVVMRKTDALKFVNPILNIENAIVRVASDFDTLEGTVNINFQSQLFVDGADKIAGGNLNLTVTDTDVALLNNETKREMLYTIVHAPLGADVKLDCNKAVSTTKTTDFGEIEGTDYVYTSLKRQGLFVMHADLATTIYVNDAWKDNPATQVVETFSFGQEVIKGKAYWGVNAFGTFQEALTLAKDNGKDTTIVVTSDVTETYSADLFVSDTFKSNLTVKSQKINAATGVVEDLAAAYTVTMTNTAAADDGRMDLCLSPAGATEAVEATDTTPAVAAQDAKKITFAGANSTDKSQAVNLVMAGNGGVWFDYQGNGGGVILNDSVNAAMVGFKGAATVNSTSTITATDFCVRASESTVSVTGTNAVVANAPATADGPAPQITAGSLDLSSGVLNVTNSIVQTNLMYFTDDNVIGKQHDSDNVTGGKFTLNSNHTTWTVLGYENDDRGLYNYFYKDHPAGTDGKPTFTAELNFTNGSVLDVKKTINNVLAGADTTAQDANPKWTYAGHGTPMTINFEGSQLLVGSTVSNAGVIDFKAGTASVVVPPEQEGGEATVATVIVGSTADINDRLFNKNGGTISLAGYVPEEDATDEPAYTVVTVKGGIDNKGTFTVGENAVLTASGSYYAVSNESKMTVSGGTVCANVNAVGLYNQNNGTLTLENATLELTNDLIFNITGAKININGDVIFMKDVVTTVNNEQVTSKAEVTGTIKNFWLRTADNTLFEGKVVFGVSNTGTGAATVKANINGGVVAFSKAEGAPEAITFDWAVTGVTQATATAGEAIATAKLLGSKISETQYTGTVYVDRAGITLTDSGYDVAQYSYEGATAAVTVEAHKVYNNTNSIEMANGGVLTLDLGEAVVGGQTVYNNLNWTVQDLTLAAGGMLKMDYKQVLTVNGVLDAPQTNPATVALTVDINGAEDLDGDKLVIAWNGFTAATDNDGNYTYNYSWISDADCFVIHAATDLKKGVDPQAEHTAADYYGTTGLYLDSSRFLKVSQHHLLDTANGWYQDVNAAATSSVGSRVRILEGTFADTAYLNGKIATVVGNYTAPDTEFKTLTFQKNLYAGVKVSDLDPIPSTITVGEGQDAVIVPTGVPAILNMKIVEGGTSLTVKEGTNAVFNNFVVGGDNVSLGTGEQRVNYYRVGDVKLEINGGKFDYEWTDPQNTGKKSSRTIIGGMVYQVTGSPSQAVLTGDVNLTISGGTFKGYNVYGGNYAASRAAGKNTRIDGNVHVTINTTKQDIEFANYEKTNGGKIYLGSMGASTITGDTKLSLTGANDVTGDILWGGCDGDYTTGTAGKITSFVDGDRILSFEGFTGDLIFNTIDDFSRVEISGTNVLNFAASDAFNLNVTSWKFAADAQVSGTFAFDFTGDTVDMTALTNGIVLNNVTMTEADLANVSVAAGLSKTYANGILTIA